MYNFQEHSIKEIKKYLQNQDITEEIINLLASDSRQGVKKLAKKYQVLQKKEKRKKEKWQKQNSKLIKLNKQGFKVVVGVDEAGRGPLAGPVVAAAVILDPEIEIIGLDDSKKLTERAREELFTIIQSRALAFTVGIVDNIMIDKINILQASLLAMKKAIEKLELKADYILVDGNQKIADIKIKQETIIDGDSKVNNIAAASIIAKVTRDRLMYKYNTKYPQYGFVSNKGYGTSEHINALKKYGPSPLHRFSFKIVNEVNYKMIKEKIIKANSEKELQNIADKIAKYSFFSEENLKELRKIYYQQHIKFVQ